MLKNWVLNCIEKVTDEGNWGPTPLCWLFPLQRNMNHAFSAHHMFWAKTLFMNRRQLCSTCWSIAVIWTWGLRRRKNGLPKDKIFFFTVLWQVWHTCSVSLEELVHHSIAHLCAKLWAWVPQKTDKGILKFWVQLELQATIMILNKDFSSRWIFFLLNFVFLGAITEHGGHNLKYCWLWDSSWALDWVDSEEQKITFRKVGLVFLSSKDARGDVWGYFKLWPNCIICS